MAYIDDLEEGNDPNKRPETGSGYGSLGPAKSYSGPQASSPQQGGNNESGGSWINLQKYMGLNQAGGQAMNQGMANQYQQQGAKATKNLNDKTQDYSNELTDQAKKNQWNQDTGFNGDTDPNKVSGFAQAENDVKDVGSRLDATATQSGRQSQMNKMFGGPDYTGGMGKLDSFLTGSGGALDDERHAFGGGQFAIGQAQQDRSAALDSATKLQQSLYHPPAPPPPTRPPGQNGSGGSGGVPSFDDWLKDKISSGEYSRDDSNRVWAGTTILGGPQVASSTEELQDKYNKQYGLGRYKNNKKDAENAHKANTGK